MPYALIPEGFELKKVTKAEEQAVNAKRRHDNIVALFNNPTTPPVIATGSLLIATPIFVTALMPIVLEKLEQLGYVLTDIAKDELTQASTAGAVDILGTSLFRLSPAAPLGALDQLFTGGKVEKQFEKFVLELFER